jgi:hypothetical protein
MAVGPLLFWPLMLLLMPRWLSKGQELATTDRQTYRALIRLAIRDALSGSMDRRHGEILHRAGEG